MVASVVAFVPVVAFADDATSPAPPPNVTMQPPLPPASPNERNVDRHGFVLLGGLSTDGDYSALRIDAMVPVEPAAAPRLRVGLLLGYDSDTASVPGLSIQAYAMSVALVGQYDWRLAIQSAAGDFVVAVDGGPAYGRAWVKIDEQQMPGEWQSVTAVSARVAASFQYRAQNGFVLALQPLGILIPIWNSTLENFATESDLTWEGALLAGYQFQ